MYAYVLRANTHSTSWNMEYSGRGSKLEPIAWWGSDGYVCYRETNLLMFMKSMVMTMIW
jgi:hypothetical protein